MAEPEPARAHLGIERIYLRDLSFESPEAPGVFGSGRHPQVEIDLGTRANRLEDTRFEVVLTLTVEARDDERTLLIVELQQAGIFRIAGMDEATRRRALAVACPNVLFPYARETIDQLTVKGNFPPFMLAPVNFEALYMDAQRRRESEQSGTEQGQVEQGQQGRGQAQQGEAEQGEDIPTRG